MATRADDRSRHASPFRAALTPYKIFARNGSPPMVTADGRRRPDRRRNWRGGRRDNDWTKRPAAMATFSRLQQWLYSQRRRVARWVNATLRTT